MHMNTVLRLSVWLCFVACEASHGELRMGYWIATSRDERENAPSQNIRKSEHAKFAHTFVLAAVGLEQV